VTRFVTYSVQCYAGPNQSTMKARSESPLYRWQCCGCKAIFSTEKNAKLHVAFHVKAVGAPATRPAGPPGDSKLSASLSAVARGASAGGGGGGGGGGSGGAGGGGGGVPARRLQAGRPSSGVGLRIRLVQRPPHWTCNSELARPGGPGPGAKYQKILLEPAARSGGGSARILATHGRGRGDSDRAARASDSDLESSDSDGDVLPRAGPGAAAAGAGGCTGTLRAAAASARGGDHDDSSIDWQEDRDDAEHAGDALEPGKQLYNVVNDIVHIVCNCH